MKILIACEYPGRVRDALSCDLLPSESFLGPHYQGISNAMAEQWG